MLLNHSSPVERSLDIVVEERLQKSMRVIFSRFEVGEEERVQGLYCSFTSRRVLEFSRTLYFPFNSSVFSRSYVSQLIFDPSRSPYQLRGSNSEFVDLWVSTTQVSWECLQLCKSEFLWPQTDRFILWLPYTFGTVRAMPMVHIDVCDHRSTDICFPLYSQKLYVLNFMLYIWVWVLPFSFTVVIDFSLDF